eukprot:1588000-Alexandrium_andersonii.AAC.1
MPGTLQPRILVIKASVALCHVHGVPVRLTRVSPPLPLAKAPLHRVSNCFEAMASEGQYEGMPKSHRGKC